MFVWWGLWVRGLSAHRIPSRPRGRYQHDPLSCYSRAARAALGLEGPSAAAHRARRRGHDGGRRRHGSGHGPRAGGGGRACRRANPDGLRRGRRSAGNSVSTYGSHARIGQTDSVCQFGCGIVNAWHTSRGDPDTRPAARSAAGRPPWPRDAPAAAGQHSFAAPRPVRCFAVWGPRLHAGAGLTLRPTAPSKVLLKHPSRNTFAVCSCDVFVGAGALCAPDSLEAQRTLSARSPLVLLPCCSRGSGSGGSVGSRAPGAAARTRWWSQASRIGPRAAGGRRWSSV